MHALRPITSTAELRGIIGAPTDLVRAKLADRINGLTRQLVERSPFVCVATACQDRGIDISPRGDSAGFVSDPEHHIERTELPSHGEILRSLSLPDLDVAEHERARGERYARREGFY